MPVDYSKWKEIQVSDDEDDTHPNVDTASLFRWRHQKRMDDMSEMQREKEDLRSSQSAHERKMAEIRKKLSEASVSSISQDKEVLLSQLSELEKQEQEFRRKEAELERKEKLMPWNVDTISHEGFSKTIVNTVKPLEAKPLTEEEKTQRLNDFIEKHKTLAKEFGMLRKWDASKDFLLAHPELCCAECADYLTIYGLNLEIEEKHDLMEHVAHQTIAMQYLLELSKQLNYAPSAPQLITSFFSKIQIADKTYIDAFEDELRMFKERICTRAAQKREEAIEEYEKEEREKRLGPGGLDPVEVFESLPPSLQKCFEERDTAMLEQVLGAMPPMEAKDILQRCIGSGLWIPDAKNAASKDVPTTEAETELRHRKHESMEK